MASLLTRGAWRAAAVGRLGVGAGRQASAVLRQTTRQYATSPPAGGAGGLFGPSTNLLIGATMFWAATFVYAAETHAFDAYLQGDRFHKEKAKKALEAAAAAEKASGEEEIDWEALFAEDEPKKAAKPAATPAPKHEEPKQAPAPPPEPAPAPAAAAAAAPEPKKEAAKAKPAPAKEPEAPTPPPAKAPAHYSAPYVLVGAGTASYAAMKAIQEKDPNTKILIVGEEEEAPYMRPPLSKELWFAEQKAPGELKFKDWNGNERDLYFQSPSAYVSAADLASAPAGSVGFISGVRVVHLNVNEKKITLANGDTASYNKLLIATGGRPKSMRVIERASREVKEKTTLFRKIADFHRLNELSKTAQSVTIVGGGFLGSELAVALGQRAKASGLEVNQVFPEEGNMGKIFPKYLSQWTTKKVQAEGVKIRPKSVLKKIAATDDNRVQLTFTDGGVLVTDHVLVAVGLEPNVDIAIGAGLEIDPVEGGIMVNAEMAGRTDVYVAGDVASFHDPALGRRRVEHHDHAVVSGRLAGENMADASLRKPYRHQSMFWSDLGPQIGYEAIGIIDSSLETVSIWAAATDKDTPQAARAEGAAAETAAKANDEEEFGKGVVFYMRDQKVVGILLWNIFGKIPTARKIIGENKTVADTSDLAKLFNVHN